jgi:hypothetical protein
VLELVVVANQKLRTLSSSSRDSVYVCNGVVVKTWYRAVCSIVR